MAGVWGRGLKARAMGCEVATTTLRLRAWVSSLLPARPRLYAHLICNCGIRA
jgi:hypothetical protein